MAIEFLPALITLGISLFSIVVGSLRSGGVVGRRLMGEEEEEEHQEVFDEGKAKWMAVVASLSLLLLFYFFDYIQWILVVYFSFVMFISLFDLLDVLISNPSLRMTVAALFLVSWLLWGTYFITDLFAITIAIFFLKSVRLPSLKVSSLLLLSLLIYDVFWVFLSPLLFEKNVMVTVAMKDSSNPIAQVSNLAAPSLPLPIKIVVPLSPDAFMALGLGDIVLPGLLVALALNYDTWRASPLANPSFFPSYPCPLFTSSLISYVCGLGLSMVAGYLFQHPQPALLYLSPSVLLGVTWKALKIGCLSDVWNGRLEVELNKIEGDKSSGVKDEEEEGRVRDAIINNQTV